MFLCINRFAQAQLIQTNNIGHAGGGGGGEQDLLSIAPSKNSRHSNPLKLYDERQLLQIRNDGERRRQHDSQKHLLNWSDTVNRL